MYKELTVVQEELYYVTKQLQIEYVHTGEYGEYLLNKGSEAADFLLESTESEREFILHKLCPELKIVEVYETNHLIFKLK